MSITHQQRCCGVQRKLATYLKAMTDNTGPGVDACVAFDAAAWAFTGTLTHSAEAADLVSAVAWAFERGADAEDWDPETADRDEPDPRVGIAMLKDVLSAYHMLRARPEDHWDGTVTGYDCAELIETWGGGDVDALLYLDEDDTAFISDDPQMFRAGWFYDLAHLNKRVPRVMLEAMLAAESARMRGEGGE
jgi:hypothetical protein